MSRRGWLVDSIARSGNLVVMTLAKEILSRHIAAWMWTATALAARAPVVTYAGETMRLAGASVASGSGGSWTLTLQMSDDNGNTSLPNSWRRW